MPIWHTNNGGTFFVKCIDGNTFSSFSYKEFYFLSLTLHFSAGREMSGHEWLNKKILDMGYLNQTELATKLGKTQSTIANKLRLLNLPIEVQEALKNNISFEIISKTSYRFYKL